MPGATAEAVEAGIRRGWGNVNRGRLEDVLAIAGQDVLDVGCASGGYVAALADAGVRAVGVDVDFPAGRPTAAADRIARGSALSLPFAGKSFDTALAVNVLEHVDDRAALRELRRVLRRNLFVSVPHVMPEDFRDFEAVYPPYIDPTHLRYYTAESLARVLEEEGFRPRWVRPVHPVNVVGLALRTLGLPRRAAKAAGTLYNRLPGVRKYHYNLHAVADVA